jgi:hypothetical protein
MAIRSAADDAEVIGVAQVVNKNRMINHGCFSAEDEKVFPTSIQLIFYSFHKLFLSV